MVSSVLYSRTILAKLRRARLLAGEDPHNPGHLDTHPLVREYFGEQLRSQQTDAWKESNRRLYNYYRRLAPELPDSFRDLEPLFLAVICGCKAGLFHEALHEVYIPRIQRDNASFAGNVLGVRGGIALDTSSFFRPASGAASRLHRWTVVPGHGAGPSCVRNLQCRRPVSGWQ